MKQPYGWLRFMSSIHIQHSLSLKSVHESGTTCTPYTWMDVILTRCCTHILTHAHTRPNHIAACGMIACLQHYIFTCTRSSRRTFTFTNTNYCLMNVLIISFHFILSHFVFSFTLAIDITMHFRFAFATWYSQSAARKNDDRNFKRHVNSK